uniref:Putative capsid protein n=2 Tax=viral metagenome TaxID=1070528 RepID=A0A6M3J3I1_9ZZZZ
MQAAPSMGYIGMTVMPPFYVNRQSATFPVIPKEALFNLLDTKRGPLGHYNRGDEDFEEGYYRTVENGLERLIDDRFNAIYSTKFAYELTIANILMNNILRSWEYRVANLLLNETNFETAIAASTAWSNIAATPKADVDAGKAVLRAVGIIPNALIINYTNFLYLALNTEVRSTVTNLFPDTARTGNITIEHLKAYFEVPQILVAGAMYNTAKRGQDASLSDLWSSTYAMLAKIAPGPTADITEPCVGRTVIWNEGAAEDVIVEQYRDEGVRGDVLRVRHDTQECLLTSYDNTNTAKSEISKAAGYLIDVTGS